MQGACDAMSRPLAAPPNVPDDRVALLRRAFDATVRDPEFLAQAEKQQVDINPMSGEEVESAIARVLAAPKDVIARTRAAQLGKSPQGSSFARPVLTEGRVIRASRGCVSQWRICCLPTRSPTVSLKIIGGQFSSEESSEEVLLLSFCSGGRFAEAWRNARGLGSSMSTILFSPSMLRQLDLGNRIVVGPMCQYAAENGTATDWHIMHLGNFAVSGSGLVIAEATGVEPEGRISALCLGLYSDANERALARIVSFFKTYGGSTKFGVQLAHAGRKGSVLPSFVARRALRPEEGGWTPISPSYYVDSVHAPPAVMDLERVASVRAAWRQATERAARIGVDLIELHFAHGYLVNQFLSPLINHRDDQYGGSRENRMRIALEIFEDCRAVWPAEKPMGVKISPSTGFREAGTSKIRSSWPRN